MKQNLGKLTPVEGNLFVDGHGRKVLVDSLTKKAYVVTKQQVSKSNLFANRLVTVVLLTGFFGFYFNWIAGLLAGGLLFVAFELFYRKGFLSKLEEIEADLPEIPKKQEVLAKLGKTENTVRLVCGIALPLLLIFYVLTVMATSEKLVTVENVILYVFAIAASVYAVYIAVESALALQIIKKEEK